MATELAEPPVQQTPFGTNMGDLMSQTLRSGIMEARAEPKEEVRVETEPVKETEKEVKSTPETQNRDVPQEPTAEEKAATEAAKIDKRNGKPQQRWSEIPLGEGRDILTADEARRKEAFDRVTKERDEAAKAKEDLAKEVETLRQKAAERDELSGKYERLNETYAEQQKRLASVDVTKTDEYQEKVLKPYSDEVAEPLKELASRFKDFNLGLADKALRENDVVTLAAIRKSLPDEDDRSEFKALEVRAKGLVKLHNQYVADAPKAYKEITERKTAKEKQEQEARKAEITQSHDVWRKAQNERFAFLDPNAKDLDPALKKVLQDADESIGKFDFNSLKPQEQSKFIVDAHRMLIAANVLDGYNAHVTKQKQEVEAERDTLKAKVAELEGRLAKRDGTTFTPGRTGIDSRVETPTEYKGDAAGLLGSLLKDARKG